MALCDRIGGRRRVNGMSFDEKKTRVAFVATSVNSPTELYIADADGKNERKLTGFNDRINAEIAKALKLPEIRTRLQAGGAEPAHSSPQAFTAFLKAEIAKWTKVVKAPGATVTFPKVNGSNGTPSPKLVPARLIGPAPMLRSSMNSTVPAE